MVRRVTSVLLMATAIIWTLTWPTVQSAATTPGSALTLLATAMKNAENARWVHETNVSREYGVIVERMADTIGTTSGQQVTSFANGGQDDLIALDSLGRLYEKANAQGLLDYRITTDIPRYANQWMLETPSNPGYAYNAFGTTLQSDFSQFDMKVHLEIGPIVTKNGELAREIMGDIPTTAYSSTGTETMWVSVTGPTLPLSVRETYGNYVFDETWTGWGRAITFNIPSSTLPYP